MATLSERAIAAHREAQEAARRKDAERHAEWLNRALAFITDTFGPVEEEVHLQGVAHLYRVGDVYFEVREEWTNDRAGALPWMPLLAGGWQGGFEPVRDLLELGIELAEMAKPNGGRDLQAITQHRERVGDSRREVTRHG